MLAIRSKVVGVQGGDTMIDCFFEVAVNLAKMIYKILIVLSLMGIAQELHRIADVMQK